MHWLLYLIAGLVGFSIGTSFHSLWSMLCERLREIDPDSDEEAT